MKNEKNGKLISECERNSVILQPTWEKVEGSMLFIVYLMPFTFRLPPFVGWDYIANN